ncbi:MAG TPA: head maturation protease, ClpP-related, partial [Beijerinckiaceae bacterium]|nr:head maturation protease, ClpP-related [Beijerinckiaceae bacterium]
MKKTLDAALLARAARPLAQTSAFDLMAKASAQNGAGKSWFRVNWSAGSAEATVSIDGEIGFWGITSADFVRELSKVDAKTIRVNINSPGGSIADGVAIYAALAGHKAKIIVNIVSLAASIASVIAMAGDEINIGASAAIMVHPPWSFVIGGAKDMRAEADILDLFQEAIIDIYEARTGRPRAEIEEMVANETWLRGEEAVSSGFADAVVENKQKPKANLPGEFYAAVFKHLPEDVRAALAEMGEDAGSGDPEPPAPAVKIETKRDLRQVLQAHGMSRGAADALAAHFKPPGDARDEPPARPEPPT